MITDYSQIFSSLKSKMDLCGADEIVVNGARGGFMYGHFGVLRADLNDIPSESLLEAVCELAWSQGLRIDPNHPACGGIINQMNLRWHVVTRPVSEDEFVLTLRNLRAQFFDLRAFQIDPTFSSRLDDAIGNRHPILIAGATGVGKTSFLVALIKKYFLEKRIIIVESLSEIPLLSNSWIRLVESSAQVSGRGKFSLSAVAKETLRLRPDTLVVGELRGDEAAVFLDLSITGHGGCLSTIHASSPQLARERLKRLSGDAGRFFPEDIPIVIVQLAKTRDSDVTVTVTDVKAMKLR